MDGGNAILRGVIGTVPGAILGLTTLGLALREPPSTHDMASRMAAVAAVVGASFGAAFCAYAGAIAIPGKAKATILACACGILIGLIAGWLFNHQVTPSGQTRRILACALGGGAIGAICGRLSWGGRLTLGELMIVVAISAPVSAVFAAIMRL